MSYCSVCSEYLKGVLKRMCALLFLVCVCVGKGKAVVIECKLYV